MRISKGLKNSLMGFLSQFITIGVGIIIPRLVLVNLGSEANGLLNSIGNVLSYLSLLEAGVGMASLQVLYRPAAEANHKRVNEIMAATDYYYKRSGMWYAIIILIISVVYLWKKYASGGASAPHLCKIIHKYPILHME